MKIQITNTEYKSRGGYSTLFEQAIVEITDGTGLELATFYTNSQDVTEAASGLSIVAVDALNTYLQHPILPSELLEQNKQMKEALEKAIEIFNGEGMHYDADLIQKLLTQIQNQNGE